MAIIVQHISDCLDRGETPATIFLDIQKAFDSISHQILLYKLSNAGIRGNCLRLLESYLHGDRKSTRLNSSHITRSRMPSSA